MVLTLEQQIDNLNFDKGEKLAENLERLPPDASEAIVEQSFYCFFLFAVVRFFFTRTNTTIQN